MQSLLPIPTAVSKTLSFTPLYVPLPPPPQKEIVLISVELLASVESIAMLAFAWDSTELQLSPIQQEGC